jgi:hypothetical protein
MSNLDKALEVERKATRRFMIAKNMFFVYIVAVTLFTAVQGIVVSNQLRDVVDQNAKNAQEESQKTQEYIKCIAITLLKPLAERKNVDFENCTIAEDKKSSAAPTDESTTAQVQNNAVPITTPQPITRDRSPEETTGAAPPDPNTNTPNDSTPANENSRVLTIIDGVLQEVDNSISGGKIKKSKL